MQFLYHSSAGKSHITLDSRDFHYVFDVRRQRAGDILTLANMLDSRLYDYRILAVEKKRAILELADSKLIVQKTPKTHIIQAVIDMNEFGKTLPYLNELSVEKITFFYGDFSQRNERVNIEKLNKILINSSMQCGRLSLMQLEVMENLYAVLEAYKGARALDFSDNRIDIKSYDSIIVGPEGGFSKSERELLKGISFGIDNPLIMRAKTASIFIAASRF